MKGTVYKNIHSPMIDNYGMATRSGHCTTTITSMLNKIVVTGWNRTDPALVCSLQDKTRMIGLQGSKTGSLTAAAA